jgi:MFS family permease
VFATYRRVLTLPGALAFSLSGLVARFPISMVSLGIVLLVSTRTGSYSLAGSVSAAYLVSSAVFAVLQARLIDRLGQRTVLPVAAAAFATGLLATMVAVEIDAGAPWPHLFAALAGAGQPQIGSSVRARWSYLVEDKRELHTAFAFEAVVDETVFIVGPALVTVLATTVHPLAGLVTAILAAVVGTAVLVSQRRTEPPPSRAGVALEGHQGPHLDVRGMPWRVMGPLIGCAFLMGVLLGGAEVATVARSDELGATSRAGLMLALWALGSLLSGVATGALPLRVPNPVRFRWGTLALGLLMLPLPFVDSFVMLGLFLFLSGFAISPTLIASFAWIEEVVPPARLTEGITLFTTGLAAGLAPGAALVGLVVDASGAASSYWVSVAAGVVGAGVALLTRSTSPSGSSR